MSRVTARAVAAFAVLQLAVAPASAAPSVSRRVLENGLTVLVSENPAAPVVAVSLQVRAGSRFETPGGRGSRTPFFRRLFAGRPRAGPH